MKKLILLLLLISNISKAQDSLSVTEMNRSFSLGNKNCFVMDIPQTNYKSARSNWKSYLKKQSKRNSIEKNGEITLPLGPLQDVTTDSITVFTTIVSEGVLTKLCVFVMMNDSSFLSSSTNGEASNSMNHFIRKFGIEEYKRGVNDELENETEKLKSLESNVEKIEGENESLKKDIKKNERTISRTQDNIKLNEQEQTLKSNSILQEKTVLNNYVGSQEQKEKEEKLLKQLTKEKEKLQDKKESMMKDIDDLESDNRGLEKKIDKNNDDKIPEAKEIVAKQKIVVSNVQSKLNRIQ